MNFSEKFTSTLSRINPYLILGLKIFIGGFIFYEAYYQSYLAAKMNFSFDEFNEAARVYASESGRIMKPLRNGFHYFYLPIKWFGLAEEHIAITLRLINIWVWTTLGFFFLYKILRKVTGSIWPGLFAIATIFSIRGYMWIGHQTYRTDQFALFVFFYTAHYILTKPPAEHEEKDGLLRYWAIPAVLMAFALFHNPKAVYYFLCLFLIRTVTVNWLEQYKTIIKSLFVYGIIASVLVVVFTALHMYNYDLGLDSLGRNAESAANTGLGAKISFMDRTVKLSGHNSGNPLYTVFFLLTLVYFSYRIVRSRLVNMQFVDAFALAAFCFGLTLYIHRGVYNYYVINYIPIFVALAALTAFYGGQAVVGRYGRVALAWPLLGLIILGYTGFIYNKYANLALKEKHRRNIPQLTLVKHLDRLFPDERVYSDGAFFLPSRYNVMNLFTWKTLGKYKSKRLPWTLQSRYTENPPAFHYDNRKLRIRQMRKIDRKWFYRHYGRLSDRLWVIGQLSNKFPDGTKRKLRVVQAGPFRWSSFQNDVKFTIDGKPAQEVQHLEKGSYTVKCIQNCDVLWIYRSKKSLYGDSIILLQPNETISLTIDEERVYFHQKGDKQSVYKLLINGKKPKIKRRWHRKSFKLKPGTYKIHNPTENGLLFDVLGRGIESST